MRLVGCRAERLLVRSQGRAHGPARGAATAYVHGEARAERQDGGEESEQDQERNDRAHGEEDYLAAGYRSGVIDSRLPLLFLDVDGPLLPFGATREQLPDGYPTYKSGHAPRGADANPLITRIDPAHGPRFASLPCTLVWATTWMSDANDCVAPWLGLPELPVVDWPEPDGEDPRDAVHWKTRALVDRAAGRPFAWVDDEITDADRTWVRAHHPGPALLHRVDARLGLTDADFTTLGHWLRTVTDSP